LFIRDRLVQYPNGPTPEWFIDFARAKAAALAWRP
jgi:hypothetical protein